MTLVTVSAFFAPTNPKRPANFVVLKYFLLGLLISNAIESILIIPKIMDVLDQERIQTKELEEINIKKEELEGLVAEKESEMKQYEKERDREVNVLLKHRPEEEVEGVVVQEGDKVLEAVEVDYDEELPEERKGKSKHHNKKQHHEEHEGHEKHDKHGKHEESEEHEKHPEVRKRPQRKETGANLVAVFMLFYGSITLCLGVTAVFRESALLLAGLIGVTALGILILISAEFSLIMIMSCCKDILIGLMSYKYRDMIVTSDAPAIPGPASATDGSAAAANNPFVADPYSAGQMPQQVAYS